MRERSGLAVFLLSAGTAGWNAGNVGPVVVPLSEEFSVSLAAIGLLAGTYFFAGIVAADIAGSAWARRIAIGPALRTCCLLCFGGNLLFALSPEFAGLVAGRVLVGVGAGIALLFGAAFAREVGGVRTLGLFGAGITLGVAVPLALGSILEDAGAESRSVIAACIVVLLLGVGFSLPYPLFYDEGERALPDRPLAGLGLLQVGSNAFPIVAIPLIGEALSDGREEVAFLSLAGLVAVTALVSLGPGPATPAAEAD